MKYIIDHLIDVLKALSDKTRLRTMWVLQRAHSELCVCEIIDALDENQYNVSRHLRILKNAGLVRENKQGRFVFYSLSKTGDKTHRLILELVSSIDKHTLPADAKRLAKRLSKRKNGKCVIGMRDKKPIIINTQGAKKRK